MKKLTKTTIRLYWRSKAKIIYNLTTLILDSDIKFLHIEKPIKLYDNFQSIRMINKQKNILMVLQNCNNALFSSIAEPYIHIWASYLGNDHGVFSLYFIVKVA